MINDDLNGTTVLVTGGAGFIGSHLVDALLESGAKVRVLDNFETGRHSNIAHVVGRIELIEGDIRDLETCQRACAGAKFVFHEAALGSVPRSLATPANTISVNVSGTANVFTAARDQKVSRVVYASSSSVYGTSERLPKREGEEGRPLSPYAMSKWMNEELAAIFEACFKMQLVGLRYFNVYGPRQDPNGPYAAVIPRFFASCRSNESPVIYGDGTQSRDFTFVADVVSANLHAMLAQTGSGRAYNVGAGQRTTVNDLASTVVQLTSCQVKPEHREPRAGDVLHSLADTTSIRDAFGWVAKTNTADGLKQTAEYF
jgi:UDP-N-acetylglucosamine/UDP-N-acetylgalactosamine 4-epimerase